MTMKKEAKKKYNNGQARQQTNTKAFKIIANLADRAN